jgi:EAL domain-containing protein (putative c-di-GMP-specific phosphodiesterase class I)
MTPIASRTRRRVVEASLALARSLKLVSVAEGVQTQADWDFLCEVGCDVAQGYYLARPLPVAAMSDMLQGRVVDDAVMQATSA